MANYNFKKFFDTNKIHNNEYVSNGYFVIKREALTKAQNNFVDTFTNDSRIDYVVKLLQGFINDEYKYNIFEFIPALVTEIHGTDEDYQTVIDQDNFAIKEEYYNFFKSLKCRIFRIEKELNKPMYIYNSDNTIVGIVLPVRVQKSDIEKAMKYDEYIELQKGQEEQEQQRKQNMKKCLYISNNKAIVRNKELTCIADILNDETYRNLYIEPDYQNNNSTRELYIDFGFICYCGGNLVGYYNINLNEHKERLDRLAVWTIEKVKNYIANCIKINEYINVAEIKLMELAGESAEYIQTLTDHRQKVLDLREQKHKEQEEKRERENQEYVDIENAKAVKLVLETEQAIINKETVQNKDITVYKSRYESNTSKLILYIMKMYDINAPLKTQGWINQALANIFYDESDNSYSYQYYNSSKDSTTFNKYLNMLVDKINVKYGIIAAVS